MTMASNALSDALALLHGRRALLVERLERVDAAIAAVMNVEMDEGPDVNHDLVPERPQESHQAPPAISLNGGRPSLRSEVLTIVGQYPNGVTPRQITDILTRKGDPRIEVARKAGRDPTSPVRTALHTAFQAGQLIKAADGTWRLPGHVVPGPPALVRAELEAAPEEELRLDP